METISIRDLRGTSLRASARRGKPLAITNHRVIIGIFIPVAAAWVEHLFEYNWSHVRQSITEGEQAMASGAPMTTPMTLPLQAGLVGQAVTEAPQTRALVEQLQAALAPPAASQARGQDAEATRTVRIGDLSASVIDEAGQAGQTVAVTHQRELIGILIPVTQGLVQFLIEQNLSRVLYNIRLGEDQLGTANKLTTVDELVDGNADTSETGSGTCARADAGGE